MAADLQTRPAKHDAYVENQLAKVRRRLRRNDLALALLLAVIWTLGYSVLAALFDLHIAAKSGPWGQTVRGLGFLGYLGGLGVLAFLLVRRFTTKINPRFAARELEKTIPDAKNSVVNWLDLQEEKLPGAIRNALGLRAARDLKKTEPEKLIDPRANYFLGGVAGTLVVVLLILFVQSPMQFASLMQRAFFPFGSAAVQAKTRITLVQPAGGNVSVQPRQKVEIRSTIEGWVPRVNQPKAPTLHFRYVQTDAFAQVPLEEDNDGSWMFHLTPDQVQNGLWYKLSAGDAETPEYAVGVRSVPEVGKFTIQYRYRPYLVRKDETVSFPNQDFVTPRIKGEKGTQIFLTVKTNRDVASGMVVVTGDKATTFAGKVLPDDPRSFGVEFPLVKTGSFQVIFTSTQGESNSDRQPYPIDVIFDGAPIVELTKPGQDVSLPANGTLPLEGSAKDDYGIQSLALRLKLQGSSQPLASKPYRPGKLFRFEDGAYPDRLDYKDFLALDSIKTEAGKPVDLQPKAVIEYWLEAMDNFDQPAPQVGKSQVYKITILAPDPDAKKQKAERDQLNQQQKEHEKQQDRQNKQDELVRNQDQKKKDEELEKTKQDLKKKAEELDNKLKKAEEDRKNETNPGKAKGDDPQPKPNEGPDKNPNNDPNQKPNPDDPKKDGPMNMGQGTDPKEPKKDGPMNMGQGTDPKEPKKDGPMNMGQGNDPKEPKKDGPMNMGQGNDPKEPKKDGPMGMGQGNDPKEPKKDGPMNMGQGNDQNPNANPNEPKKDGPMNMGQGNEPKNAQNPKNGPNEPKTGPNDKTEPKKQEEPKTGGNKEPKKGPEQNANQQKPSSKPADPKAEAKPGEGKSKGGDPVSAQSKKEGKPDQTSTKPAGDKNNQNPGQAKEQTQQKPGAGPKQGDEHQAAKSPNPMGQPETGKQPMENNNDPGNSTTKKDATMEDLKRLIDQAEKGDPQAKKSLDDLAKMAQDPEVQKAAEKAMKDAGPNPMANNPMAPGNEKPTAQAPEDDKNPLQDLLEKLQGKGPEKKPGVPEPGANEPKQPNPNGAGKPSTADNKGSGQNAPDPKDKLAVDEKNERKAGDLNLRKMKDAMTQEMLKKAGISEAEWEQFLKDAQAYQDLEKRLQSPAKTPQELRGGVSQLPGQSSRPIQSAPGAVSDPLNVNRGQAPPGFAEDYQRWTTKKK